jgi:hypothetical protein
LGTEEYHRGRYENQGGSLQLVAIPKSVERPVPVKVGEYTNQSNMKLRLRYLYPETTTYFPPSVSMASAQPIIMMPHHRVVIIGADVNGGTELVGSYAIILGGDAPVGWEKICPSAPLPGHAWVTLLPHQEWTGFGSYFSEKSLCRSYPTDI